MEAENFGVLKREQDLYSQARMDKKIGQGVQGHHLTPSLRDAHPIKLALCSYHRMKEEIGAAETSPFAMIWPCQCTQGFLSMPFSLPMALQPQGAN